MATNSMPVSTVFPGRWIGRGSPIPWPARSPDLSPLYYFLWGYLKSLVFETPVETGIELVARIVAVYYIIQNTSGIFVKSAAESCTPMSCLH